MHLFVTTRVYAIIMIEDNNEYIEKKEGIYRGNY